jgi:nitroreductase
MDFQQLIRTRYSARAYKPDEVEAEKLDQVLEAFRLAPTAANRQPFRLMVIRTKGREQELRQLYDKDWFVQAPLVLCACGVESEAWIGEDGKDYLEVDVAIAMDHLILAATELGLGTCWIGAFHKERAMEFLSLPEGIKPVIFTPLGYPADEPEPKVRRSLADLVRFETWVD